MSRQEGVFDLLLFADAPLQDVTGDESLSKVEPADRSFASRQKEESRVRQHLERRAVGGGWAP